MITIETPLYAYLLAIAYFGIQVFFVARALLRPYREPVSRLAWVVVIIVAGLLYTLFRRRPQIRAPKIAG